MPAVHRYDPPQFPLLPDVTSLKAAVWEYGKELPAVVMPSNAKMPATIGDAALVPPNTFHPPAPP
jgi:hypothetical protein